MALDALRTLGGMLMLGVRGAAPGDPALEEDLDACISIGARGVILFDRDAGTGTERNIKDREQVSGLIGHIRNRLGQRTIIAVDQEGGRVQRLRSEHGFRDHPSATQFAILNSEDQHNAATSLTGELASCGFDLNFAPCVDLTMAHDSPAISALGRSYGKTTNEVLRAARVLIQAHLERGIACCLKHFPGHGSANMDTHQGVADISRSHDALHEIGVFRAMLDHYSDPRIGVMTGHLLHRAMDPTLPASLSRPITTDLLRNELGFDGVIATDALDMDGVRTNRSLPDTLRLAYTSGADLLVHACNSRLREYAPDVAQALTAIAPALDGSLDLAAFGTSSDRRLDALCPSK